MIINVSQIGEDEELRIEHYYPEGEPALASEESRIVGRPELHLRATRAGNEVKLVGTIKADVRFDCDRCLAPLVVPVEQSFDLLYVPPVRPQGAHDERELGRDDLSVAFYQGQFIDLDDLVREQLELALPMARLCGEDCQGLCPDCGANLNQGQCSCEAGQTDSRWNSLKQWKSDN
jgi:DUF177 domain-containing protein